MTHKEFRITQRNMDEAGMLTAIKTIRVGKIILRTEEMQINSKNKLCFKKVHVYEYKYRYEVILNGAIVKNCKARITAKNYLMRLFQDKMTMSI